MGVSPTSAPICKAMNTFSFVSSDFGAIFAAVTAVANRHISSMFWKSSPRLPVLIDSGWFWAFFGTTESAFAVAAVPLEAIVPSE